MRGLLKDGLVERPVEGKYIISGEGRKTGSSRFSVNRGFAESTIWERSTFSGTWEHGLLTQNSLSL